MTNTVQISDYVELTVTRPNGTVEIGRHPSLNKINDNIFAQIVKGTKDAGRGNVTAYRNMYKTEVAPKMDEADKAYMSSLAVDKMSRMGE